MHMKHKLRSVSTTTREFKLKKKRAEALALSTMRLFKIIERILQLADMIEEARIKVPKVCSI